MQSEDEYTINSNTNNLLPQNSNRMPIRQSSYYLPTTTEIVNQIPQFPSNFSHSQYYPRQQNFQILNPTTNSPSIMPAFAINCNHHGQMPQSSFPRYSNPMSQYSTNIYTNNYFNASSSPLPLYSGNINAPNFTGQLNDATNFAGVFYIFNKKYSNTMSILKIRLKKNFSV